MTASDDAVIPAKAGIYGDVSADRVWPCLWMNGFPLSRE
jgi:hypothetical protein